MKHIRLVAASAAAFAGILLVNGNAMAQQAAPPASLAGVYTLAQVEEAELPVLISEDENCRREITAATLTLQADNKWKLDAKVKETCGEAVSEKVAVQEGSFTATAQALQFTAAEPEMEAEGQVRIAITAATVAEDRLVVTRGEGKPAFVFRRG